MNAPAPSLALRAAKALSVSLVYRTFGFRTVPGLIHEGVPPEFFFALSFDDRFPQGSVTFHEGFTADGPSAG